MLPSRIPPFDPTDSGEDLKAGITDGIRPAAVGCAEERTASIALEEIVHDDPDLQDLRAAKSLEADAASVPLADVMRDLGIEP